MGARDSGGLLHLLFLNCRGRLAHLVPEGRTVPKVPRVVEVRMATRVLWDPLARRYVTQEVDRFPATVSSRWPWASRRWLGRAEPQVGAGASPDVVPVPLTPPSTLVPRSTPGRVPSSRWSRLSLAPTCTIFCGGVRAPDSCSYTCRRPPTLVLLPYPLPSAPNRNRLCVAQSSRPVLPQGWNSFTKGLTRMSQIKDSSPLFGAMASTHCRFSSGVHPCLRALCFKPGRARSVMTVSSAFGDSSLLQSPAKTRWLSLFSEKYRAGRGIHLLYFRRENSESQDCPATQEDKGQR